MGTIQVLSGIQCMSECELEVTKTQKYKQSTPWTPWRDVGRQSCRIPTIWVSTGFVSADLLNSSGDTHGHSHGIHDIIEKMMRIH